MAQEITVGQLTLVAEQFGSHMHVVVLGNGPKGDRPMCGRITMTPDEWASLRTLSAVAAELNAAQPVIRLAHELGKHWRDQQGVSAYMMDKLEVATRPPLEVVDVPA